MKLVVSKALGLGEEDELDEGVALLVLEGVEEGLTEAVALELGARVVLGTGVGLLLEVNRTYSGTGPIVVTFQVGRGPQSTRL